MVELSGKLVGLSISAEQSASRPAWIELSHVDNTFLFPQTVSVRDGTGGVLQYERRIISFYLPPDATPEEIQRFYDKFAARYDLLLGNGRSIGHKAAKFIADRVQARTQSLDSKVLDLYAGTGFVSGEMVALGYGDITLLDISGNMLNSARQKASLKDLNFVQADFSQCKPDEKYDVVICSMGLHYNKANMNEFLASVERVTEPNGLFACIQSINPRELWDHFQEIECGVLPMRSNRGQTLVSYFIGRKQH